MLIDNTRQVLAELERKIDLAMKVVGEAAEGYAKEGCPVDTGRLRNSITYVTRNYQSPPNTNKHPNGQKDAEPSDYHANGTPKIGEVWIGSNVEYAAVQEYGDFNHTVGHSHYLQGAANKHAKEYQSKMKQVLKE